MIYRFPNQTLIGFKSHGGNFGHRGRPGRVGGSTPRRALQEFVDRTRRSISEHKPTHIKTPVDRFMDPNEEVSETVTEARMEGFRVIITRKSIYWVPGFATEFVHEDIAKYHQLDLGNMKNNEDYVRAFVSPEVGFEDPLSKWKVLFHYETIPSWINLDKLDEVARKEVEKWKKDTNAKIEEDFGKSAVRGRPHPHAGRPGRVGGSRPNERRRYLDYTRSLALLNPEEAVSIREYMDTAYERINSGLRHPERNVEWIKKEAGVLKRAISKLPPYKGDVVRGMESYSSTEIEKWLGQMKRTRTFRDRGFLSTSANPRVADYWRQKTKDVIIFHIKSKTGRDISSFNTQPERAKEKEVLFLPNTKFRITKIEKYGNEVYAEEI